MYKKYKLIEFHSKKYDCIRGLNINGKVWYLAMDIVHQLGFKSTSKTIKKYVDESNKILFNIEYKSSHRKMIFVDLMGIEDMLDCYRVKKPNFDIVDFTEWIEDIYYQLSDMQTWEYDFEEGELNEDEYLSLEDVSEEAKQKAQEIFDSVDTKDPVTSITLLKEENEKLKQVIEEQMPKVLYYEKVMSSNKTFSATSIAQSVGWTVHQLYKFLHKEGVVYKSKDNGGWYICANHVDKNLMKTVTFVKKKSNWREIEECLMDDDCSVIPDYKETEWIDVRNYWTAKGREFVINLIEESKKK